MEMKETVQAKRKYEQQQIIWFHFAKIYSVNKGDKAREIGWSRSIKLLKCWATGELVLNFSRE